LSKKQNIQVIDAYGINPTKKRREKDLIIHGLTVDEITNKIDNKTNLICIYAGHVIEHNIIIKIIKAIKKTFKNKKVLIFENAQAVTAYSLRIAHKEFFKIGADFIVYGDPEETVYEIISKKSLKKNRRIDIQRQ